MVFHQGGLLSGSSLIRVAFRQVGLSSVVSHQDGLLLGGLSPGWSFIRAVFHQGGFSSGWSFIRAVFYQGGLSSGWSFIRVVFH